jgi:hypothetical protein
MTALLQSMPQLRKDVGGLLTMMSQNTGVFGEVPAGLAHYEPLVRTMNTNVDNHEQVSSLPNFDLVTAFFMVPGALIALLAAFGLIAGRERQAATTAAMPRATTGH